MFQVNLNAGDPDAPEEFAFIETVGTGQPPLPTYDEEYELVEALESQFIDLQFLFDDIHKSGGMSQQLAMEARKLIPEFSDKYPVGYFTKEPTKTLLRPALEEIHHGIWALIGAAAVAIMAAIWKFVKWLRRDKDADAGPNGAPASPEQVKAAVASVTEDTSERKEASSASAKAQGELAHKAEEAGRELQHAKKEEGSSDIPNSWDEMTDAFIERGKGKHEHFKQFLRMQTPEHYDIIKHGRWTETMLSLGPIVSTVELVLTQRARVLEDIVSTDLQAGDPVRFKHVDEMLDRVGASVKTPGIKFANLQELADSLRDEKRMMSHNVANERMKMIPASDSLKRLMAGTDYQRLLDCRVKFVEQLAKLHAIQYKIHELSEKSQAHVGQGIGQGIPRELAAKFGQANRALSKDVIALMSVQGHIEGFIRHVESVNTMLLSCYEMLFVSVKPYLAETESGQGAPKAADEALEIVANIKKKKGFLPWSHR